MRVRVSDLSKAGTKLVFGVTNIIDFDLRLDQTSFDTSDAENAMFHGSP